MTDRVLILDFGSQVTQLIARRIREAGVYCEIMPFNTDPQKIAEFAPKAIIFSGGPASVTEMGTPRAPEIAFEMGVPLLGICYGHQTLCAQLGGEVEPSDHREFGRAFVEVVEDCALLDGVWRQGRAAAGLDEPWRPGDQAAPRLPRRGGERGRAARHRRRRRPALLRPHVPSRGGAYARGRQGCWRASCGASPAAAATGPWPPSASRRSPRSARPGGQGPRHLRPLRRGRFRRGRRADP